MRSSSSRPARRWTRGRSGHRTWRHDVATGEERRLARFEDRPGALGVVALAASEEHLYLTWEENVGDLWMMERVR